MILSSRLSKIASLIPKGKRVCDVGTDHAYIPLYSLIHNNSPYAIAMDINKGPLEIAKNNAIKYNLGDKIDFRLSDGLCALNKDEADVIVIAGMGGPLICEILNKGKDIITNNTHLIIQPMIAPTETRMFLYDNYFNITNEYVVKEENKYYNIFELEKSLYKPNDYDIYIGKNLLENSSDVINDYLDYKISICEKILNGLKKAINKDNSQIEKHKKELSVYLSYKKEMIR